MQMHPPEPPLRKGGIIERVPSPPYEGGARGGSPNGRNPIVMRLSIWWTDNNAAYNDPNKQPDRLLTHNEKLKIAKTGFADWYDWSIANWGTKWNAYDHQRLTDSAIYFETAWSAPTPVLEAMAAKFPEVDWK